MFGADESLAQPSHPNSSCVNCGHPHSDHPMDDVCWHDVVEDGKVRLCSCPGFQVQLQARSASERAG